MTITMRKYTGPADLRPMQELTQRVWSKANPYHIGDLAWGRFMFTPGTADWPIALWETHGRVVAWAWAQLPDDLRLQVDPAYPRLLAEILTWFDEVAEGGPREISVLDGQSELMAALTAHGYEPREDSPYFTYHARDLTNLPTPVLPAGFTAQAVRGARDLDERVAVHRAAWNSVRVTSESYSAVMAAWPYQHNLDWVVVGPDNRFVANCLIWYDDIHRVGLIEPVGTAPEFRRLGLSRACCTAALHALRDAGGATAIVYPRGDDAYPIPQLMYRSLGFRPYARTHTYLKI